MFFRHQQIIRGLALRVAGAIQFRFDSPSTLSVILTRTVEKQYDPSMQKVDIQLAGMEVNRSAWPAEDDLLCIVQLEKEVPPKARSLFEAFARGEMSPNPEDVAWAVKMDVHRTATTYVQQASQIPELFYSFATQVHKEMYDYAIRIVRVLRWRANASCPHNPVCGNTSEFSLDGNEWMPLPLPPAYYIDLERDVRISKEIGIEIVEEVQAGNDEPLAHVLLREAWNGRKASPRSALLIGISAAEVGLKQSISKLIPEASWILSNLPSPPIVQILSEYLPLMPAKLKINGKVVPPPEGIIKTIRDGVTLRNKVVHSGKSEIKPEKLGEILNSVEDLLWLLDYYCGYEWALNHIRNDVRAALGVK